MRAFPVALLAFSIACAKENPAPPVVASAAPPDAGALVGVAADDAGSASVPQDAGTGGSDAGTGGSDAGTGGSDAGTGGSDAGTPPAKASWSGKVAVVRLASSSSCDAAMPGDPGTPVVAALSPATGDRCDFATADGQGRVMAECWGRTHAPPRPPHWVTFDSDGRRYAEFEAWVPYPYASAADGMVGFTDDSPVIPPVLQVVHRSALGVLSAGYWVGNDEHPSVVNRRFGAGVLVAGLTASSPQSFAVAVYDGEGRRLSQVNPSPSGRPGLVAVGEDRSGAVGYASGELPGPLSIVFIDPATGISGPPLLFDAPPPQGNHWRTIFYGSWVQLYGLAGGGVEIVINGLPTFVADPSSNTLEPAPEWLRLHPDESFLIVRHGEAQALVKADPDSAVVTVVSRDGEVCGTISVSDFAFGDIGFDGTLVGSTGPGGAVKVWWPGLLR